MSHDRRFPPPPRRVPASLVIANVFNLHAQFGWAFFGFGMIFFWLVVPHADRSFVDFRGPPAEAVGEVVRVEKTNVAEGPKRSATPIYANHYTYAVAGRPLTGVAYSVGPARHPG